MSKRPRAAAASPVRPAAWAQALFVGSVLLAGMAVWLLVSI
jgi:hypothetical protein